MQPFAVLDGEGRLLATPDLPALLPQPIDAAFADRLLRGLLLARVFDERMIAITHEGKLGFYLSSRGNEALHIGAASVLREGDWIFPSHRETSVALWRGYSIRELVDQLFGNAEDLTKGRQLPVHYANRRIHFVSSSSIVATQLPQATGMGWAARLAGRGDVAAAFFGDGAISSGEFHVGLNFAGVYRASAVFVCRSTDPAANLAARALSYGLRGVRVDGDDLLAVMIVVADAAARARAGEGATLIEAIVPPLPSPETDPLTRASAYLASCGATLDVERVRLEIEAEIAAACAAAPTIGAPPVETLFDDVFAELPPHLVEQRAELLALPRSKPLGSR